jgi:hypothetical protein
VVNDWADRDRVSRLMDLPSAVDTVTAATQKRRRTTAKANAAAIGVVFVKREHSNPPQVTSMTDC